MAVLLGGWPRYVTPTREGRRSGGGGRRPIPMVHLNRQTLSALSGQCICLHLHYQRYHNANKTPSSRARANPVPLHAIASAQMTKREHGVTRSVVIEGEVRGASPGRCQAAQFTYLLGTRSMQRRASTAP